MELGPRVNSRVDLPEDSRAIAVLLSGGIDSAVLLGELARGPAIVHPIYVRCGLAWEAVEAEHVERFLGAVRTASVAPLHVLDVPVRDLYGDHWSVSGRGVPGFHTPDEAVFLPGRNVLLLGKAMIWCLLHRVDAVALATLSHNPFPDATNEFFTAYEDAVNRGIGGHVRVLRPYAALTKAEVLARGRDLPLELTFSCIQPTGGLHCGQCNKCAERQQAFQRAGMVDATRYAASAR